MCGICGIYDFEGISVEQQKISQMMQIMKNRGPDDEGLYLDHNVGLGFVRLSIIDLTSAGHQPMLSDDQRFVIVYNGEIYNYIELRNILISKGYIFKTETDTEVLIKSYIEWGEDCLNYFNGMWAFVIYDTIQKSFFGARDRFGIKPFYYLYDKQRFVFASDFNAIKDICKDMISINNQAVFDYLVFNRTDYCENTFYNEILRLPHACCFTIDSRGFKIKKWYDLRQHLNNPFSSSEEYVEYLVDSIKLRLRSDVPIGTCLSGGLDSSSIVSILVKFFQKSDMHTFSAIYNSGEYGDESKYINIFKHSLQNMHFIKPTAESLFNDCEEFVFALGEPIPSTSVYAQFKVMQLAKDYTTVTLDGQGADEELAGYPYFFGFYFKELFLKLSISRLAKEIYEYIINQRSLYGLKTFLFYLLPNSFKTNLRKSEFNYLNSDFGSEYIPKSNISDQLYNSKSLNEALIDHFEHKLEHLLKWEDRNSMHFSLEARVPFLDYRLAEKTLALQSDMIIRNGWTKNILRQAMKNILPEEIRLRKDKIGFETPQADWFRTAIWQSKIKEILAANDLGEYINLTRANILYRKHLARKISIPKEIWKWINLFYWLKLL